MNAITIRPLDALARRINEQQYMIVQHSKSMLEAARIAGEALIEAKKQLAHGQFKQWVEANTSVSYATAAEYMRVARIAAEKNLDLQTFDAGIRALPLRFRERRPTICLALIVLNVGDLVALHPSAFARRIEDGFEDEDFARTLRLCLLRALGFDELAAAHVFAGGVLCPWPFRPICQPPQLVRLNLLLPDRVNGLALKVGQQIAVYDRLVVLHRPFRGPVRQNCRLQVIQVGVDGQLEGAAANGNATAEISSQFGVLLAGNVLGLLQVAFASRFGHIAFHVANFVARRPCLRAHIFAPIERHSAVEDMNHVAHQSLANAQFLRRSVGKSALDSV
ncbi:DUF3102 domain-containing protein [Magnetospirillum gryphiswaldense]|uniref:DUF3102 domain-containing protein n=1 Tax=Magnetospirillum gryphiswaldense TaxID=55518 RepID=UPI000D041953|nr:DUF3102 domain-containing protein [Magnetospirillum gryphiswaldense]AVM74882.1 hypothetical protein MSR1_24000 [Magnetospirillum gryphiswaldense MSR-1]AVM78785.1 hypothetical protein MSR1L_24000 [Magnetospirillum gryphiswaldense]